MLSCGASSRSRDERCRRDVPMNSLAWNAELTARFTEAGASRSRFYDKPAINSGVSLACCPGLLS